METAPLIEARSLEAGYGGHPFVWDLNLKIRKGEITALLGPNGAGKTTSLMVLAGHMSPLGGELLINGKPSKSPLSSRAREGLGLVTEDRSVFFQLTVAENLKVGRADVDYALDLFPELKPLLKRTAGLLSGGEQQMLTVGRALSRRPQTLLLDELSLGLAPLVVIRLLDAIRAAADEGVGVLLVEQHVEQALRVADNAALMQRGRVVFNGTARELEQNRSIIEDSYIGV
jgi:branched-chain amino acid transport system ATP-binding protein